MSTTVSTTSPKLSPKQTLFLKQLDGDGACLPDLMKAMGWQRHSVRAAPTGLRKLGIQIERLAPAEPGEALYRVKTAVTSRRRRHK